MKLSRSLVIVGSSMLTIGMPACDESPVDLGTSGGKDGVSASSGGSATSAANGGSSASGVGAIAGGSFAGESASGQPSGVAGASGAGMSSGGATVAGSGGSAGQLDCNALACGTPCGGPANTYQCSVSHHCGALVAPCPPDGVGGGPTPGSCAGRTCGDSCVVPPQPAGVCNLDGKCSTAGTPPPCF